MGGGIMHGTERDILTIISRATPKSDYWLCSCACGTLTIIHALRIVSMNDCGCRGRKAARRRMREFRAWLATRQDPDLEIN